MSVYTEKLCSDEMHVWPNKLKSFQLLCVFWILYED